MSKSAPNWHSIPYNPNNNTQQQAITALLTASFGPYTEYYQLALQHLATPQHTYLWGEGDTPYAHLQVVDYIASTPTGNYPIAYLYAICTAPEYRGKGFMLGYLAHLIPHLCNNGYHAVALLPANSALVSYYQRLGMVLQQTPFFLGKLPNNSTPLPFIAPHHAAQQYLKAAARVATFNHEEEQHPQNYPGWMLYLPPQAGNTLYGIPLFAPLD